MIFVLELGLLVAGFGFGWHLASWLHNKDDQNRI